MTSMNGINNLNISRAAMRNGCNKKADQISLEPNMLEETGKYQEILNHLLTLKMVMNRYTDEISKLAILAKLPVPKNATLNKTI